MSKASTIRRAAVAAVLTALSVSAAEANAEGTLKATFRDVLKPDGCARSKAAQIADGEACGTYGPTHTLSTPMPVFEKCMRAKGWVFDHYTPDPSVPVEGTVETYTDTRGDANGHPRHTDALHADERACGAHRSGSYKRCLADHGWKLVYTQHGPAPRRQLTQEPAPEPTWIDPDTGLTCHSAGIASICSNF